MELDVREAVRARGGDALPHQEKLEELLDATLASTLSIRVHLRPGELGDFGLVAEFEWLTTDTAWRSGLFLHLEARPEEFDVPAETASARAHKTVRSGQTSVPSNVASSSSTVGRLPRRFSGRASVSRYSATPTGRTVSLSAYSTTSRFFVLHRMSPMLG